MSYSLNGQTFIDSVLTSVKEELHLTDTTTQDWYLRKKIKEARQKIESLYDVIETESDILEICDASVLLPSNFVMFFKDGAIRFDPQDNNPTSSSFFLNPVYTGQAFFKTTNLNPEWGGLTSAQIVGKYLSFNSDIAYKTVKLAYLGLRYNDDGTPFIPERAESAMIGYACWNWIRSNKHLQQSGNAWTSEQMMDYKLSWITGKSYVEASSRTPDQGQWQAINRLINSWF